jgi:primary-amine oxidase
VVAVVDMNRQVVVRVDDSGVHPVPPRRSDFDEASNAPLRPRPKPLSITHPEGPDYTVSGSEVSWQRWRFRVSVDAREGLVLHDVRYRDGDRERPVLYRASLSEMLVPYGDPDANWSFRNAFDVGEYGLGRLVNSLKPGADLPANATTLDVVAADDYGKPFVVPGAIGLWERDGGLLWKHREFYGGHDEVRRARELVVSVLVTVANYDYGLDWIFHPDGSMRLEAVMSGIMLPKGVDVTREDQLGEHAGHQPWHLVAPNVAAPHHQHFFNFRLDMDVETPEHNRVVEVDVSSAPPGPGNPGKNAMAMTHRTLAREREARRDMSFQHGRRWIVQSTEAKNQLGQAMGYMLVPGENGICYLDPESPIRRRGRFVDHHLWVTPFAPDERYAAGDYPNQSLPGQGLPHWTNRDRVVEDRDLVVWYTFVATHVPRPEEWPVMPAHRIGFKLIPVSFFDQSPVMDVPR